MHSWGDDWPHWNDLYEAERFIIDYVYKHSWCRLSCKEKWGTIRYEWVFPPRSGIYCKPWTCVRIPFVWKEYNKNTKKFHFVFEKTAGLKGYPVWRWCDSWLHNKWEYFGWKTVDRAIVLACRKWPQVRKELLADWTWKKY